MQRVRLALALTLAEVVFAPVRLPQLGLFSHLFPSVVRAQGVISPGIETESLTANDPGAVSAVGSAMLYLPVVVRSSQQVWHNGEGTYYDATGAGNCSFDPSPEDLMVAAMNHTDYAVAALCGAYVQVVGPQGTVTVRIVDRCPECAPGDIDFSQEAFAKIAPLVAGRVPIQWRIISPPLDGPIVYRFKEGSNQWWTAVQIRNHRNPIAKVEYQLSTGDFKEIPRTNYNYFVEASGMGPGPYTFRVTDMYGNVLQDAGIPHVEGGELNGSGQFPPGP